MCVYVCAQLLQSCSILCDAMDCKPPGSSVHRISQVGILGLPFPFPRDLPNSGIEPISPALAGGFFTTELPRKPMLNRQDSSNHS